MKTILVTGASGFLGPAVVNTFLQKNYQVIAIVHNEKNKSQIPSHPHLQTEVVDLKNEEEVTTLIARLIAQFKVIDGALLLAGGYAGGSIDATSIQDIQQQVSLNFETAYTVVKIVYPHFIKNKNGRIVLVGSQAPLVPKKAKSMIAYTLSKSLLFQLAQILNEDAKGTNVVTTVVVPSTIDTKANRDAMPGADFSKWVKPEQMAEIIEYAVSDKADVLREPVLKLYNGEG
jgi:NAD(P)-dependent dehydrogenase (short-subunit alcohol dehydrogenase family)